MTNRICIINSLQAYQQLFQNFDGAAAACITPKSSPEMSIACKQRHHHWCSATLQEAKVVEAEWKLPGSFTQSCRIIMEGDPGPSVPIGHLSYGAFNPAIEQLHREAADQAERKAKEACNGKSVSDADMAAQLGADVRSPPHKIQRTH